MLERSSWDSWNPLTWQGLGHHDPRRSFPSKRTQEKQTSKLGKKLANADVQASLYRKTWVARGVALFVLLNWYLYAPIVDGYVESCWQWMRSKWWFRHDSFEPVWATLSFAVWLNWFTVVDRLEVWKQYLINAEQRHVDYHTGVPYRAGVVYLGIIMGYDYFNPRQQVPDDGPGSLWQIVVGVVLGLILYDAFFFPMHVAMHHGKYFRKLHAAHHTVKALYSTEVLRHSLIDGSLQVGTNILVINLLRLHPMTRMVYNSVITYMLTEIHSGFDCPWMIHRVVPFNILGGPRRHEEHHNTGIRYYQQFFCYLDDYFFPQTVLTKAKASCTRGLHQYS
mmetsp:Transcript_12555/g.24331  ORF Transcript_12555/g.24331 Transcript_12555/m.24331 type:complete len:336 (-) Transcript_12555:519-1526(-)